MVRFVFLDIDGVLVTRRPACMEIPQMMQLKRIIQETGARIVLSSDWRRSKEGRAEARRQLERGAGLRFVSWTSCMSLYMNRPIEILRWLNKYVQEDGKDGDPVESWVHLN
eukprot:TRINITY_DN21840_c0_g1_i1.p3 TRINITY_DN21840_c0_g1~~TRINITY_DN21840_c0_g1_i1.p3  ORF type:complete len:111 (+),score=19.98 TRINITY_DN21840_c0_g1_i1:54-386(+)